MKKNINLQLLLSLALGSEIFYIAIASLGDLRQHVPTFLGCFGAAFSLYWAAARGFFGLGKNREKRKRQDLWTLPSSIPPLFWLERILHLKKSEDKLGTREILIIGLVFGLVFRITMLITEPSLSDDVYRYIWDGKVASHGINPFQHPPNADTLQTLRDSQYYPKINHREISTIYPPVSQMVFSVVYKIKPTVFAFKVVFLLFDLLTIAALLLLLRSLRLSLNRSLLYVWNPLIIVEFSGNAHADIIGDPGPVPSQIMFCGFILMAPQTFYPTHNHTAVELYLVLGGTAEWQRGTEPWTRRPPGAFILHRSEIGHAMRSLEEPLLALYAWHGDLESDLVMPLDDL